MIDHLSGGRLDLGVGRGVSPYEVACYGLDPKLTRPMFEEALDILLAGLTGKRLKHEGRFYRVADMPMVMDTVQKPYPPLWYGAANVDSARYAARYGMHFTTLGNNERVKPLLAAYSELWAETASDPHRAGSPVSTPLIGLGRHVVIADNDAEAERLAKAAYAYWWNSVTALWREHNAAPMTGMLIPTFEEAHRGGQVVCGAAERVRNELAAQIKDMKFNYLLGQFTFGNLTHTQEMKSFDLFVREVMPALAKL
jgi:alkanesulfonate monooxygenase SsuD/methylene tetrahydromethanopterin reductase-like flavin-dependent oxidoreductase (luciferase family)